MQYVPIYLSDGPVDPKILIALWLVSNALLILLYVIELIRFFISTDPYKSYTDFIEDNEAKNMLMVIINGLALFIYLVGVVYGSL